MTTTRVRGQHVGAERDLDEVHKPGAFQWEDTDGEPIQDISQYKEPRLRLSYCCPRTGKLCGSIIVFRDGTEKPTGDPSWGWDGDTVAPTLTPSINCVGGCKWHGGLKKGTFVEPYSAEP